MKPEQSGLSITVHGRCWALAAMERMGMGDAQELDQGGWPVTGTSGASVSPLSYTEARKVC